ncbi:hypothetical protein [Burkholderia contaminans]|uniref:hypothetical protein n=1 Tax=Burkholderia contaminans TaxID=488447 RepID=UPI0014545EFA|nr:hypothetical protein [Burkholderia contaminans]MCA8157759.1 hypothetical protein [Burkholderia contaminans]VWD60401.1 hypothetical protein BCO19218_07202 [Burkholderia contaminans]
MSNDLHEIALGATGRYSGMHQSQTSVATVHFGQISGSIDARETLLQQHLTTDLSLFVVNEAVPSKQTLMRRRVVAWALKLARDEISKSLQRTQDYSKQVLKERLAIHNAALTTNTLKGVISGRLGRSQPDDAAINYARRSKLGLHTKAADALSIYTGLRGLAPFALRRVISDMLFDRLGEQRLLELAGGLALAEALSIASGHPLAWNSSIASDGVMAKVGPLAIGWHKPMNFDADEGSSTVSANDTRTGSCISFIRCAEASGAAFEDEAIRLATESLVAACRKEAKKGPWFEETPLVDCVVLMRRLFNYEPESPRPDRLAITGFDEMTRGRLLELGRRVCRKVNLN